MHGAEHDNGTKSIDVALHTRKEREIRVREEAYLMYQKKKNEAHKTQVLTKRLATGRQNMRPTTDTLSSRTRLSQRIPRPPLPAFLKPRLQPPLALISLQGFGSGASAPFPDRMCCMRSRVEVHSNKLRRVGRLKLFSRLDGVVVCCGDSQLLSTWNRMLEYISGFAMIWSLEQRVLKR